MLKSTRKVRFIALILIGSLVSVYLLQLSFRISIHASPRTVIGFSFKGETGNVVITTTTHVFLPLIGRSPTWKRLSIAGQSPKDISTLALRIDGNLYIGDRSTIDKGGGIYTTTVSSCNPNFSLAKSITAVFDIALHDSQGLAGTYGQRIFYSSNGGSTWILTSSNNMNPYVFSVTFDKVTGNSYAGTSGGVYSSTNGGVNWNLLSGSPQLVNTLEKQENSDIIWVGTYEKGVWKLSLSNHQFISAQFNLPNARIWDIAFDNSGNVFVATADGVYAEDAQDGVDNWKEMGLQEGETEIYSLAIGNGRLYAGIRHGGVQSAFLSDLPLTSNSNPNSNAWRPEISGAEWNPSYSVRDLLYDSSFCNGLLAATSDGVWVLR